jgi:hypothetical protein
MKKDICMLEEEPHVVNVLTPGEVSDELDFFVNNTLAQERGMGLTACQPTLVELDEVGQAIRFKIDSTFLDAETDEIMGYGQIGSDYGFAGEIYVTFDENDATNVEIIYITSQEQIDETIQSILADPDSYPPSSRPRGKY